MEYPKDVEQNENVSRRKALAIIVSSAGAAVSLPVIGEGSPRTAPRCHAAATPARQAPAYTAKFFSPQQVRTVAALSETIIPADDHSPGARAARVWEFIDDLVADSKQGVKDLWKQGLAAIDKMAEVDCGKKYADCDPQQQITVLQKISRNEENPATPEEKFFVEAKRATIDGYYTSAIGIHQDLEYQGNTALADFPGCTHEEHKSG